MNAPFELSGSNSQQTPAPGISHLAEGRLERAAAAAKDANYFRAMLRRMRDRRRGASDSAGEALPRRPDANPDESRAAARLRMARWRYSQTLTLSAEAHQRLADHFERRASMAAAGTTGTGSAAWLSEKAAWHRRAAGRDREAASAWRPAGF
ncbi:hypothetical protein SAMN05444920_114155 [Nonomuraea solani]|uniref:Uncharacterized protein n=1 Tax=Nonomuraea solani TaxID=1144553 RepID=A0A1H6ESS4_9ACTN|nr:hypothetical protein [Nonomuraea solani]SEG99879.1 hypothetical protein SAMN05444920_114155 [Nonomuraea solani]